MDFFEIADKFEKVSRDRFDLLWCIGVGLFLLFIFSRFMPMEGTHLAGEKYEWMLYFVTAFIFPVIMFILYNSFGFLQRYHLLPDWRGYYEYATAYTGGFGAIPIDPAGNVWMPFLVFCSLLVAGLYTFKRGVKDPHLPAIVAALAGIWAVSSYFVSRSHPNNIINLTPVYCMAVAIAL
jgi:hypothetical protein